MPVIQTPEQLDVQIRWMIRRDMPDVLRIEQSDFDSLWSDEDFVAHIMQRTCIGYVAEHKYQPVGFMVYEIHESKLHILKLAVEPNVRRSGVGRRLVERLIGKLSEQRRTQITVDVHEGNLSAQLFLASQGFRCSRIERDAYADECSAYRFTYTVQQG